MYEIRSAENMWARCDLEEGRGNGEYMCCGSPMRLLDAHSENQLFNEYKCDLCFLVIKEVFVKMLDISDGDWVSGRMVLGGRVSVSHQEHFDLRYGEHEQK